MDKDAAKATLEGLFDRIDALIKAELEAVFGEHAGEFLKFCDKDADEKLTKDEFTSGILNDCGDMSQEDFDSNWAERMEGVVKAAEEKKAAEAPAAEEAAPAAEEAAPAAEEALPFDLSTCRGSTIAYSLIVDMYHTKASSERCLPMSELRGFVCLGSLLGLPRV